MLTYNWSCLEKVPTLVNWENPKTQWPPSLLNWHDHSRHNEWRWVSYSFSSERVSQQKGELNILLFFSNRYSRKLGLKRTRKCIVSVMSISVLLDLDMCSSSSYSDIRFTIMCYCDFYQGQVVVSCFCIAITELMTHDRIGLSTIFHKYTWIGENSEKIWTFG